MKQNVCSKKSQKKKLTGTEDEKKRDTCHNTEGLHPLYNYHTSHG